MPGLDSTGPMGKGPQTGRKLGKCKGESDSLYEGAPRGRGLGRGFRNRQRAEAGTRQGRGRGLGRANM